MCVATFAAAATGFFISTIPNPAWSSLSTVDFSRLFGQLLLLSLSLPLPMVLLWCSGENNVDTAGAVSPVSLSPGGWERDLLLPQQESGGGRRGLQIDLWCWCQPSLLPPPKDITPVDGIPPVMKSIWMG